MKRFFCAWGAIIFFSGTALAFSNEPSAFRGIQWGEPVTMHSSTLKLVQSDKDQGVDYYMRVKDDLTMRRARLASVLYGFSKKGFEVAVLAARSANETKNIYEACVIQWGEPDEHTTGTFGAEWRGENVRIQLIDGQTKNDMLIIQSKIQ
ncbi:MULTISPECIES: hypothetical protein [Jonquetella]|uniref:Uncharacterized protein n=1 Tax=Jonquetella anthropi DSM 22815 TaxID=885272 RepID=H0ULY3_9BACT|nr:MULTISPECIES: hypothetical protein [Jonquetella]EEX49022.1 hypothetical protein GCWU000246_00368 [Jonquetella anthropi E3_33 E1]EHM12525.1 hypothetical protein JonanDRAFT_0094 [Jonquetella anthropi DSM 22815]